METLHSAEDPHGTRLERRKSGRRYTIVAVVAMFALAGAIAIRLHQGSPRTTATILSAHPLPCGSAMVSSVLGMAARSGPATASNAAAALAHQGRLLTSSASGDLYLIAANASGLPSDVAPQPITVPSHIASFRSCNYNLSDNARDVVLREAAASRFSAMGLTTPAQLASPGVLWMIADDPTSSADILVLADIETPRTSTSPGTITTLVAAADVASSKILGASVSGW